MDEYSGFKVLARQFHPHNGGGALMNVDLIAIVVVLWKFKYPLGIAKVFDSRQKLFIETRQKKGVSVVSFLQFVQINEANCPLHKLDNS